MRIINYLTIPNIQYVKYFYCVTRKHNITLFLYIFSHRQRIQGKKYCYSSEWTKSIALLSSRYITPETSLAKALVQMVLSPRNSLLFFSSAHFRFLAYIPTHLFLRLQIFKYKKASQVWETIISGNRNVYVTVAHYLLKTIKEINRLFKYRKPCKYTICRALRLQKINVWRTGKLYALF